MAKPHHEGMFADCPRDHHRFIVDVFAFDFTLSGALNGGRGFYFTLDLCFVLNFYFGLDLRLVPARDFAIGVRVFAHVGHMGFRSVPNDLDYFAPHPVGQMYEVPGIICSRVPATRPGRPSAGNWFKCFTLERTVSKKRTALSGLSVQMNMYASVKYCNARSSHLTCKFSQLPKRRLDLSLCCKFTFVCFFEPLLDGSNLPLIEIHV